MHPYRQISLGTTLQKTYFTTTPVILINQKKGRNKTGLFIDELTVDCMKTGI